MTDSSSTALVDSGDGSTTSVPEGTVDAQLQAAEAATGTVAGVDADVDRDVDADSDEVVTPAGQGDGPVDEDSDDSDRDVSDSDSDDTDSEDDEDGAGGDVRNGRGEASDVLVAEGDAAGDYLERLLDILDYDGDIDLDVEGERAVVSIIGDGDVNRLVGERGEVLDALQELTRLAAMAETGHRSRLMLDIAGYRARRRSELGELGLRTAREVADTGETVKLSPMNAFERKIVHDAVATVDGVESSSEGEEPRRRVVVSPAS